MKLFKKSGEIVLESDEIDLKIASDRDIYIRKDKSKQYKNTHKKIPQGFTIFEKETLLFGLRESILQNKNEVKDENED